MQQPSSLALNFPPNQLLQPKLMQSGVFGYVLIYAPDR